LVSSHKSVLIADADSAVRKLVSCLFERVGYPVHEAAAGDDALEAVERDRPGLAILDVGLPSISGYELCRELKDRFGAEISVVLVSADRTEPFDRVGGLLVGADDYLAKPFDSDELLVRARRLLERQPTTSSEGAVDGNPECSSLTNRELEILRLLAAGKSQQAIANELIITPKTVSTHVQRILTKLGVHNQAQAVAAAFRLGIAEVRLDPLTN
jgi:DNA-binding NarL/FixJ family response regulator